MSVIEERSLGVENSADVKRRLVIEYVQTQLTNKFPYFQESTNVHSDQGFNKSLLVSDKAKVSLTVPQVADYRALNE